MRLITMVMAVTIWASSVLAQAAEEIEGVIGRQLEAFNARDVDEAWQYAAPNIQGMFRNAQNFGVMVQRGYPMVWSNKDPEFLDLTDLGNVQVQRLMLRDQDNARHFLEYQMVRTASGWRIAGVRLLPAPDIGV